MCTYICISSVLQILPFTQEFKSQCFGGEFTGEVYDHVLKK